MAHSAGSQRALLAVLALAAVAGIAFLFVGNPFAGGSATEEGRAGSGDGAAPDAAGLERGAPREAPRKPPTLDPAFAGAGKGAVRARLLNYKDRKPIVDQAVRLARASGETTDRTTGADGVVLFTAIPTGPECEVQIEGKTFASVSMKGVEVRAGRTTDLGDLLLGDKVVLRGKVVDSKDRPIAGATVAAHSGGFDLSEGMIFGMVQAALHFPTPAEEARSDDAGRFELRSLTAGTYRLTTRHPGYAMNFQSDLAVAPERAAGALKIVLGPGAKVTGRVTDERGAAVANATVIALESGGRFGGPPQALHKDFSTTDATGRYAIDTLSRGTGYLFGVSVQGWAPQFETSPTTVEEEAQHDFTLVRGGTIDGTVTDKASGKPVAEARVLVIVGRMSMGGRGGPGGRGGAGGGASRGGAGGGAGGASGQPAATDTTSATGAATTKEDGTFHIEGMRPGPVMIAQVKAQGFSDYSASQFPGGTPAWADVTPDAPLAVKIELEGGGTVTGKITSAADGSPIPGAQVSAVSMASAFLGSPKATADANGEYRIDGIKLGAQFSVLATAPGFAAPDLFQPNGQVTMPETGGSVVKDVALDAAAVVEGLVTTSKGEPVAGARVRTKAAPTQGGGGRGGFGGRGMWRALLPGGASSVLSDVDGRYRIENVAADGKLIVEADADDFVTSESAAFEPKAGSVAKMDVVLSGGGTIRGRVIDDSGRVVPGARVRVGHLDADTANQPSLQGWTADRLLEARTVGSDDQGWFEIPRVPPGQTLLKAEKEGYVPFYRRDLNVPADGVLDHYSVTIVKGETISGVVKGEDGKPVAGALVAVTGQQNPSRGGAPQPSSTDASATAPPPSGTVEPSMSDRTDEQGRFTVENVPPGPSYSVVIGFANGYRGWWGPQADEGAIRRNVPAGARDVEFVLKKAAPINLGNLPGAPPAGMFGGAAGGTGGGAGMASGGGTR